MPRLTEPSWIMSELCLNPKQAHILPKPRLQRKTEGCPFGRHINHLWHWQEIHPGSNSVWVSFTLKIPSLHISTINRGQLLQKDHVLTTFLLHRSCPPYAVEGGVELLRPQEKQTWDLPILCMTVLDMNVCKCKSAWVLKVSFRSNGTRLHILPGM